MVRAFREKAVTRKTTLDSLLNLKVPSFVSNGKQVVIVERTRLC